MTTDGKDARQHLIVFQQDGSGEKKIEGLRKYGRDMFKLDIVNIDGELAPVLDDTSEYLPEKIECDLVLDFLRHNDLSADLAYICGQNGVPVVASGKKLQGAGILTPPT